MQVKLLRISLLISLQLLPLTTLAQKAISQEQLQYQRALQEIDAVMLDTGKLDDPLTVVSVKSKAASLVWRYDRKRSQQLFLDLWIFVDQQGSEYFDQDAARTVVLKNLFPINPSLATKLLQELSDRQPDGQSLRAQATGTDPSLRRLANLSAGLVDADPAIAARLLEQSLSMGVTPAGLSVLSRIRERNSMLASFVVSQTLDQLRSRPTIVALAGLFLLSAHVFPSEPYLTDSSDIGGTDERLRSQFFAIAYEVMRISLEETDTSLTKEKRLTERDLRFRAIYQGQIAMILAALAPRYGPQFVEELNTLARRFSGSVPAHVADMSKFIAARLRGDETTSDNPAMAIGLAIAKRDFEEARRLINILDDEGTRKAYLQTLAKAEFNFHLSESNLAEALSVARRIEHVNLRVTLLLKLARAYYRKDDTTLTKVVLGEARSGLANSTKDGMLARLLLSFASEASTVSESDAIDVLHQAVVVINSLPKQSNSESGLAKTPSEMAMAELNDPKSLTDSAELQRAFASVALIDFDGAMLAAGRLNPIAVQFVARLTTSEVALANRAKKPAAVPEEKGTKPPHVKRASKG